jgi:hypothetical protein
VSRRINVEGLEVDEDNIAEMQRHGLTVERLFQVWEEAPRYRRNRAEKAGSHQMIGPDRGGGFWTIPIVETEMPNTWRPVTGWQSEPEDINWYWRSR